MKFVDLSGNKYGRLTVVRFVGFRGHHSQWECRCECGKTCTTSSGNMRSGHASSCGCLQRERRLMGNKTHGKSGSLAHWSWLAMRARCNSPKSTMYPWYGAKGITVCERWNTSFQNFLDDMGERPSSRHSIDRINNEGNYEPGNCRWATYKQQARNTSQNRFITFRGQRKTVAEWAEFAGLRYQCLLTRINELGWTFERAISMPVAIRGHFRAGQRQRSWDSIAAGTFPAPK